MPALLEQPLLADRAQAAWTNACLLYQLEGKRQRRATEEEKETREFHGGQYRDFAVNLKLSGRVGDHAA